MSEQPEAKKPRRAPRPKRALQFLVVLNDTDPLVWRRIEVPETYTFWDLHVAIQDAMGWQDYHLHEFNVWNPATGKIDVIGLPDGEHDKRTTAGWEVPLSSIPSNPSMPMSYTYDFGDDWSHTVVQEDWVSVQRGVKYPRCVGGARQCPPEDCGGPHGYVRFLEAITNPKAPDHRDMIEWIGGSFDPDEFDPAAVVFSNPRKRLNMLFEG